MADLALKRGGRPPLPPELRKTQIVQFWATEEQAAQLDAAALEERISTAEYIRRRLGFPASERSDWPN